MLKSWNLGTFLFSSPDDDLFLFERKTDLQKIITSCNLENSKNNYEIISF